MATTRPAAVMPFLLLAFATSATALNAMSYKACFASSQGLTDQGSYQYQTSGYCQQICVTKNDAVLGLSSGSDCWCGDTLPPASSQVDDSKCNIPCNGFGSDKCGGINYWSVWLTGTSNDVTNAAAVVASPDSTTTTSSSSSSTPTSASSASDPTTSSTSTTSPSIVTSISPGNTVLVTVSASATNTSVASSGSSSSGTSVAGVAAGVVVGVLAVAALIGGVFFLLRHRRRRQAEQDYKRSAQVADFMRAKGGERMAPDTGYSQMSDSRLDPEAGRRNSVGSMADEHDYSRRILRVANPE